MSKKVFVSGCFDMLHSGHVAFFKEASQFGELYVGIGSDKTIRDLKEVSGSQDPLGITMPGLNRYYYKHEDYWPDKIESVHDEELLSWLEQHLYLKTLWPRKAGYNVFEGMDISAPKAEMLARAAEKCWDAILEKDLEMFGRSMTESFEAQKAMFPMMSNREIEQVISNMGNNITGHKLSGAGGGGYLIMVAEKPVENAFRIKIRRKGKD